MSFTQPGQGDSLPSPGLQLNLSSNNPFRNRAVSPASNGQLSPLEAPPRPVSRNPFLDASVQSQQPDSFASRAQRSPDKMSFAPTAVAQPSTALSGNAADLFDNLTLDEKPSSNNTTRPPPNRSNTGGLAGSKQPPAYTTRGENVPPGGRSATSGHRPSRSQEEAMRARRLAGGSTSKPRPTQDELDIFADPVDASTARRLDSRRVRRNSESSVAERKPLSPEEEKKRSERRRRERRERREKEGKDPKKPDRKLDIIDKLDVTSIYGMGLFHHDGPFDACNPHRNRQGSRRAPMQAFPKDSLNNVLGGGGPVNKRPDHAAFLGNNHEEAFKDYSKGGAGSTGYEPYNNGAVRPSGSHVPNVESATTRTEPIHGEETLGLGTSTFLEGAPASRAALQRRESEQTSPTEVGGLGRKKSLAQKIRGINNPRRDYGPSGRMTNPEGVYSPEIRTPSGSKVESNPFFNEYSKGDDTKDTKKESITIVEPEKTGRARAPSSPRRGFGERLERRVTGDGSDMPPSVGAKSGGGFLSRVKSLKGGPRKPRGDKPMPEPQAS